MEESNQTNRNFVRCLFLLAYLNFKICSYENQQTLWNDTEL